MALGSMGECFDNAGLYFHTAVLSPVFGIFLIMVYFDIIFCIIILIYFLLYSHISFYKSHNIISPDLADIEITNGNIFSGLAGHYIINGNISIFVRS